MRDFLALVLMGALCALIWYVWRQYSEQVQLAALGILGLSVLWVVWRLYRKYGRLLFGGVPYAMGADNIIRYAEKYFGGRDKSYIMEILISLQPNWIQRAISSGRLRYQGRYSERWPLLSVE